MNVISEQHCNTNPPSLHLFLQEELVFFFFHNYRNASYSNDIRIIQRFDTVLSLIKRNLHNRVTKEYLILFYRLLGYTRSILSGKGDHHLSYLMLFVWYKYFPTLAIYALHRFVKCIEGQHAAFGSWRDIKYLCQFISTCSIKQQDHSFIDICCDMLNSQLDTDLQIQNIYALPIHSQSISNVAKWIPRERKQFDWLYQKLVLHWITKHKPYILSSATDASYLSAVSKSKRLYRKKIAMLNKTIDTTQIKQCARNRHDIIPHHVSRYTQMKQSNLVFGYGDNDTDDRLSCSQHFKEWFGSNMSTLSETTHQHVAPLPIYHYVKLAYLLIDNPYHLSPHQHFTQINALNKQWSTMSKSFTPYRFGYSIPIIDVSDSSSDMNSDSYYSAIGYAILFAQYSSISNRILTMSHIPTWINLDNTSGFVSIVKRIRSAMYSNVLNSHSSPHFNKAIHLIGKTIQDSSLRGQDIRNLRLIFFSSFSHMTSQTPIYDNIVSILSQYCFHIPFIAFWNLSKRFGKVLPCSIHQYSAVMLSGFSPILLNKLLTKFKRYHTTPYNTVCNILRSPHYDILENYIVHLIG